MHLPRPQRLAGPHILAAALLMVIWLASPATAQTEPSCPHTSTLKDLQYTQNKGPEAQEQRLDLYHPKDNSSAAWPLVVYVHGGGWKAGDKARMGDKVSWLTQQGFVVASVNYRLSPLKYKPEDAGAVRFPVHPQDVAAALGWLHTHARRYCIDPARIVLMGHSAGASIVSQLGTDPSYLAAHGLGLDAVRCVISNDTGGYDIPRYLGHTTQMARKLYTNAFGPDPQVWRKASPQTHVKSGRPHPNFLIITRGSRHRRTIAQDFADALQGAGATATVHNAGKLSHREVNQTLGQPGGPLNTLFEGFLKSCAAP